MYSSDHNQAFFLTQMAPKGGSGWVGLGPGPDVGFGAKRRLFFWEMPSNVPIFFWWGGPVPGWVDGGPPGGSLKKPDPNPLPYVVNVRPINFPGALYI